MKTNRILWVIVGLLVTSTIAAMFHTGQSRSEVTSVFEPSASPPTPSESRKFGTVDFDVNDSLEATDKERRLKNHRYDNDGWVQKNPHPETAMIGRHTEATPPPAIPVQESDLVVTGRVVDVTTHLSNDKSGVYSEYKIKVDKSLKKSEQLNVAKGGFVTVDRAGGIVRYSNNQTVIYLHNDFGLPEVGKEYVFFLIDDKKGGNYKIITLYELQETGTVPLDLGRNTDDIKRKGKNDFIKTIQEKLLPVNSESRRNP